MATAIIVKETGEKKTAVYATTTTGNRRYNIDGKFYSDKKFNELFEVVGEDISHLWEVNVKGLFEEIIECGGPSVKIMDKPFRILYGILQQIAERAIEIQDRKMITLLCKLAMYEESDPTHKNYNEEEMNQLQKLL